MNPAVSLQQAIRTALLARTTLLSLLGGAHIFDEEPRGAKPPYITFTSIETRDWSVADQKAHEHFVSLEIITNSRSRAAAHTISNEVELALDNAALTLTDHKLINLRVIFTTVMRTKSTENFGAVLRFRAATEPL
jgi:Protein of unknown function (DUF3168)